MFERYTEKARRVIFFARYEASQFGSPFIETEHLMLGLMREDKLLTNRFLRSHGSVESIVKQIKAQTVIREKTSTSVDLPLSNECKRVLNYAAEEAERLGHKHIGTEHLFLGLLREQESFAASLLKERGIEIDKVREELAQAPSGTVPAVNTSQAGFTESFTDLTQAAAVGESASVVGREREIDGLIEVLAASNRANAILIGEHGVGKTAVVEGLAQRIANQGVPAFLAECRIVAIEGGNFTVAPRSSQFFAELSSRLCTLTQASNVIAFTNDFKSIATHLSIIGPTILQGRSQPRKLQCIAAATPNQYRELEKSTPWIGRLFRAIYVRALNATETLAVLHARKSDLEKFHGIRYSDESLELAISSADRYLPEFALPGKALEMLDAAGARLKLRNRAMPQEIAGAQKRLKLITDRHETAIMNHEFEKARFFSDEVRKEEEILRLLFEKYKINPDEESVVQPSDIQDVIARWSEYPFCP